MKSVLLDTHAWAWTLTGGSHLSKRARASIKRAQTILVSPISFSRSASRYASANGRRWSP